jgi:hypothetical protein
MTLKSSQLSIKTSLPHSGVAGHVITTRQPYLVQQSSFDPWLNPEVDMTCPDQAFYCVPLINFENQVIGCLQLAPSSVSPNISAIQEKIEPLALSFEKAADWLGYSLASNIWNILQYIGKPSARPEITLTPITLTEKLATMPLTLQLTEPEAIRKRRQTIVKSVTMAEESSHLPGGGLYEQHNSIDKLSTKDEDMKDFLLQFPDYEQHQQQIKTEREGLMSAGGSKTNRSHQNGIDSLPLDTSSQLTPPSGNRISPSAAAASSNPVVPNPSNDKEIENLRVKYEKEVSSIKSELFFYKEKSKTEILKLNQQINELKERETESLENKSQLESIEKKYEENVREFQFQYESDLKQLRQEHEKEKQVMEKNMKSLEEMIQSLQMKVTYVDQPIDTKHLEVVGTLNVSKIQIAGLASIMNGKNMHCTLLTDCFTHSF